METRHGADPLFLTMPQRRPGHCSGRAARRSPRSPPRSRESLPSWSMPGASWLRTASEYSPFPHTIILACGRRHHPRTGVAQREVHRVRQRAVPTRLPVLAAEPCGAGEHLLADAREDELRALPHGAGGAVDVADDVLGDRQRRPQELADLPVEGVDHTGLAGNTGDHLPRFPARSRGLIQLTATGSVATAVSISRRSNG